MKTEWQVGDRRIAPPAFILIIGLGLGLFMDWLYPVQVLPSRFAIGVSLLLIAIAAPIAISSFRAYSRAKTTFLFSEPTTVIVSDGPYRFSRNPGYISLAMLFSGIGILVNSLWALLMVVPAVIVIHFGIVKREEHYLEAKFGDEYLKYKTSVNRWV